jgi:CRP-like cAMP-binding protein
MDTGALGKVYNDRDVIVRQGDEGNCMYVIQAGEVEVVREGDGAEVALAVLGAGDVFGEMALFDREARSATVRAKGEARVLTLDKRTFMRRVHEDPSVAFRILQRMSHRIRQLNEEVARLKTGGQ